MTNRLEFIFSECLVCYTFRVSLGISTLIQKHNQSVVLLAGFLLVAAQLVSLMHAAEHPFHTEDEICASFTAFEQHDHATAVLPAADLHSDLTCESLPGLASIFVDKVALPYQSRAPPLHT